MRHLACLLLYAVIASLHAVDDGIPKGGDRVVVRGDGLKHDLTIDDIRRHATLGVEVGGLVLQAFGAGYPDAFQTLVNGVNGLDINLAIHRARGEADASIAWTTATVLADYAAGVLLDQAESASGVPVNTLVTAVKCLDQAAKLAHDRWFIPGLVDDIYGEYKAQRGGLGGAAASDHAAVWETLQAGRKLHPVIADVKKKVIYPRHDLSGPDDDKAQATRERSVTVAGKVLRLRSVRPTRWPHGAARVRTSQAQVAQGRKATIIDVDIKGLTVESVVEVYQGISDDLRSVNLNSWLKDERYLDAAALQEVLQALSKTLRELAADPVGPDLDAEAVAYIGEMLRARYAREVVEAECLARGPALKTALDAAVVQLEAFAKAQGAAGPLASPFMADTAEAERKAYADALVADLDARYEHAVLRRELTTAEPGSSRAMELARRADGCVRRLLATGRTLGEALATLQRHPKVTAPILLHAMGVAVRRVGTFHRALALYGDPGAVPADELDAVLKPLVVDGDLDALELADLWRATREGVRADLLEPVDPPVTRYDPKLEGQRVVVVDNPEWKLRHEHVFKDNRIRLEGFYHTPVGKKVTYQSQPLSANQVMVPFGGLIAAPSGTGYHVYEPERHPWQEGAWTVLHIVRLRGEKIELIHRLDVDIRDRATTYVLKPPTPEQAWWIFEYKAYRVDGQGAVKVLRLD